MAKRTIRRGVGTYLRKSDSQWVFGMEDEEVDVHKDDLERFDRLNGPEPEEETDGDAGDTGDEGGNTPEPYEGVTVPDLKAEIAKRNEGREDDAKIAPAEPGNRPELVAALVADDTKQ